MRRIPDTDRVKIGLKEAITLLCKTGLTFESELSIEGLLGITLDQNEVFLVNIKEVIKNPMDFHVSSSENTPENQDFLISTEHLRGSQQSLNCAENEAADKNESDTDNKSDVQCHSYKNEWQPSDSDDTTTELDDVLSNRSTASVAAPAEGNDTLQMKPIVSHTWDDSAASTKSVNETSLDLTVQQSQETAVQRESHKGNSDETLAMPLTTREEGNQSRTWPSTVPYSTSSSSLPAMPMNLTQKHKAPVAKSASVNRPIAMSSRVDQQADDCEPTKAKRCKIEKVNHNAPSRQERWSPESQIQMENKPRTLVTNEDRGPSHGSPWLPSVSISEGSSEVIIVKEEPANEETPEAGHESHHSSPSSAVGRDWLGQRSDGIVSSSASILSPYNEPDAHARWLQNIAAHVQGLRAPAYTLPCPSMVQPPQPLMGLLSSGKCVSAMRESATFATPVINKPFPSDALSHRRHYHKKGGAVTSPSTQTSCVNCGTITTTMWRRDAEGQPVCNACGLYYKLHQVSSPTPYHDGLRSLCSQVAPPHLLPQRSPRRLDQKCTNCGITATTAWRRNPDGKTVCNACGLYYKLYKVNRPLSMVKGEIHSRRRKPKGVTYSHTDDNIPGPTFSSPDT